jgi:hypothetical protein
MPKNLSNVIGDRGEDIFKLAITDYSQFDNPLFEPAFLGEKWPAIDFYVELCGVNNSTPFFFVQIKATKKPINDQKQVLDINAVTKEKCESLFKMTAPTYLAGVHETTKRAFILSINTQPSKGIYKIPLKYELTPDNLKILYKEVCDFWKIRSYKPLTSYFL